ncbi:YncE family protein [Corynebacterium sp. P7003]|uniref:YncE family protein n=1 Tax=Corynebacterium pygosceleis TaxID=2800406 RepID=A0ABT3WSB3_9CORY|nr:YncE family protein [Corynebacterium pygosceleis]MCX7445080.1 YncE family protein [Corynebacterium pygosceleis]
MNHTLSSRRVGKRAIAAMLSASLLTTGVTAIVPAATAAAAENESGQKSSVTGDKPRHNGKTFGGTLTADATVEAGGLLTVHGSGFGQRPEDGSFGVKINDGGVKLPEGQTGADVTDVDSAGTGTLKTPFLPDEKGEFTFKVRVPGNLEPGAYWVRVLGSPADGGPAVSTFAWFDVVEATDGGNGDGTGDSDGNGDGSETPRTSVTGDTPRGGGKTVGDGYVKVRTDVAPGNVITVYGSGFKQRPDGGRLVVKINDGAVPIGDQGGRGLSEVTRGAGILTGDQLPNAEGFFQFDLVVPEDLVPGDYWIRILGNANDGGESVSNLTWFTVTEAAEPTRNAKVTAERGETSSRSGSVYIPVTASGFAPETEVSVTVDGAAAKWSLGHHRTGDTITTDSEGTAEGEIVVEPGAAAGVSHTVVLSAGDVRAETTVSVDPAVKLTVAGNDKLSNSALDSKADVIVIGLPENATVDFVGVGDRNLLTDGQQGVSGADSRTVIPNVAIPGDAALLGQKIRIAYTVDGHEGTFETDVTITPDNKLYGTDKYTVQEAELPAGVYQSRYSAKENALFVTRTDFSADGKVSGLMKVNPDTLEVTKEIQPATDDIDGRVFGVGVDDKRGLVWTTNTLGNSLAVYRASDLSLVKQFPADIINHARAVVVDQSTGKAYASSPVSETDSIAIFDGDTLKHEGSLSTPGFGNAMGLQLNQETGDLYSVSLRAPKAVKVNVRTGASTVYELPADMVSRGSSVAVDPATDTLYVASQGTNNVLAYDMKNQKVLADIKTGAQALAVVYDPATKKVYAVNRTAGTLTVIDPATNKKIANLDAGSLPNDVTFDNEGHIFVIGKASRGGTSEMDSIHRYTPDAGETPDPGTTSSGSGSVLGLLGLLGGIGGLTALFGYLVKIGVIPAHVLPQPLRDLLHI